MDQFLLAKEFIKREMDQTSRFPNAGPCHEHSKISSPQSFMRRHLKKPSYRKNIIASIPQLLKLITALMRDKRPYEFREEKLKEMTELKEQYEELRKKRRWRTMKFAA